MGWEQEETELPGLGGGSFSASLTALQGLAALAQACLFLTSRDCIVFGCLGQEQQSQHLTFLSTVH